MRELLLYIVAPGIVFWFTYRAWGAAYPYATGIAKEAAALAVARNHGVFARAYVIVKEMNGQIPGNPTRVRDEARLGAA